MAIEEPRTTQHVLHLVGRITSTVFSFLGPATSALAEQGMEQSIVLLDDPRHRHLLVRFDPSVRLLLVRADMSFSKRLQALFQTYCSAARSLQPTSSHLHGVICLMLGLYAARKQGLVVPIFFTPHGSRILGPLAALWNLKLLRLIRPASSLRERFIVSSHSEATEMKARMDADTHLVESPVAPSFFGGMHVPGDKPRIITGHRAANVLGAELFAQCAVLLLDQVADLRFSWIGNAAPEEVEFLRAAGVSIVDADDDERRARHFASAWIFVAPAGLSGFPVFLAEAMALGLPCVAWDTASHRDLIRDGENGFLCSDPDEAIERLAELLDSPALRERIGNAARADARQRFDGRKFRRALLGVYGMRSTLTLDKR